MIIKFLDGSKKEVADLRNADLRNADFSGADLRNADLSYADFSGADLRNADLSYADLRNANLDFSVFPLWCGTFNMKVDKNIVNQLLYHICMLDFDDNDDIKGKIKEHANQSHIIKKHRLDKIK